MLSQLFVKFEFPNKDPTFCVHLHKIFHAFPYSCFIYSYLNCVTRLEGTEAQQTRPQLILPRRYFSGRGIGTRRSIFRNSSRPNPKSPDREKKTKEEEKNREGEKRRKKKSLFHSSEISDRVVERARRKIISQTSHRFPAPHRRRYARNEESRKGEPPYFRQIFTPTILSTGTRSQNLPSIPPYFSIARIIMQAEASTSILSKDFSVYVIPYICRIIHVDRADRVLHWSVWFIVVSEECTADRCSKVPCSHGGKCLTTGGDTAVCLCPLGYTGDLCETRVDLQVNVIKWCVKGMDDAWDILVWD